MIWSESVFAVCPQIKFETAQRSIRVVCLLPGAEVVNIMRHVPAHIPVFSSNEFIGDLHTIMYRCDNIHVYICIH